LESGSLYKAKTDGSSTEKVAVNLSGGKYTVTDNYILYKVFVQNCGLLKMNNSGSRKKLINGNISNIYLYKNYAYYLNESKKITRTNLETGVTSVLVQSDARQFRIDGDLLYFCLAYDYTIKSIKINGTGGIQTLNGKFPLLDMAPMNSFDIIDGYIYYHKTGYLQRSLVRTKISVDENL
jgi:hypothetical protein